MHHMGAVCTVCEPCARSVSCVHCMGEVWEPDDNIREAIGAMWEMNAPYGGHVGAVCTIWEPCVPYGSQIAPCRR
jgi:hypothetical protein